MKGLNFDEVWENIIKQIEGGEWDSNLSLSENIELKEKKEKLQKEIDVLKKKMKNEKQFNRQIEIKAEIRRLEKSL